MNIRGGEYSEAHDPLGLGSTVLACLLGGLSLLLLPVAIAQAEAAERPAGECLEAPLQSDSDSFRFTSSPAHAALASEIPDGLTIGSIRIKRFAVFDMDDPQESNGLYQMANDFHSVTREWVIRDHLLVHEGEAYSATRVKESGRILRNLKFIYDAAVRPWRRCGDIVDLEVITRDIWTFTPIVAFSRSGGENRYSLGFRDANFLGTGKEISLRHRSDEERTGNTLKYGDPALFGSRWRFRLALTENDDGHDRRLLLHRPFFSVYEQWSAGASLAQLTLGENVWFRGEEVAEFDHESERYGVFGGVALDSREEQRVGRLLLGYTYDTHEFSEGDTEIPPMELPEDRTASYPFVGYESIEDEFAEVFNVNYLGRTEDLFVGERYRYTLGWSAQGLGASRDQLAFSGSYSNTLMVDQQRLWVMDTTLSGFWSVDEEELENFWWTTGTRYHLRQADKWALFGALRVDYTKGLTLDNQLTLGGGNGLRGYDLHYQAGDRSFLINLEERYYSEWHPFRLVRVGVAAFVDVGRAWFHGKDNGSNGGVLANAGIGLRFNSSRAEKSSVLHIDLAFPFVKDDDVDEVQLLITVKNTF